MRATAVAKVVKSAWPTPAQGYGVKRDHATARAPCRRQPPCRFNMLRTFNGDVTQ